MSWQYPTQYPAQAPEFAPPAQPNWAQSPQLGAPQPYASPYQQAYAYPYPQPNPYPQAYPYPQTYPQTYPYPGAKPKQSVVLPLVVVFAVAAALILGAVQAGIITWPGTDPTEQPASPPTTQNPPPPSPQPTPDPNPTPVPYPQSADEATRNTTSNPLYQTTANAANCPKPGTNMGSARGEVLEQGLNALITCLMDVWTGPVEAAGFQMPRPGVHVFLPGAQVDTACKEWPDKVPFYCGADQQIFWIESYIADLPESMRNTPFLTEGALGHEFGHAVQYRTGILGGGDKLKKTAPSEDVRLDYSRRLELQATCLGGMFEAAVAQSMNISSDDMNALIALWKKAKKDSPTHGSTENWTYWMGIGMGTLSVASCNTFTAPANLTA